MKFQSFKDFNKHSLNEATEPDFPKYSLVNQQHPESEEMLEEFREIIDKDPESMGLPIGSAETGTMNYTSKLPVFLMDCAKENFERWKPVNMKEVNNIKCALFLTSLDVFYFGDDPKEDDPEEIVENLKFYTCEASPALEKFAGRYGFNVMLLAYMAKDEKSWANLLAIFSYDDEVADKYKGAITARKYKL